MDMCGNLSKGYSYIVQELSPFLSGGSFFGNVIKILFGVAIVLICATIIFYLVLGIILFVMYILYRLSTAISHLLTLGLRDRIKRLLINKLGSRAEFELLIDGLYLTIKVSIIVLVLATVSPNLVAALGATLISLALVFKNDLESIASGIIGVFAGKIEIGDRVEIDGFEGVVKDINLLYIVLENKKDKFVVPNNLLSKGIVKKSGR